MCSIWFSLLILFSGKILLAFNLRCNDDIHGSFQLMENCRACVIFIAPANLPTTRSTTSSTTNPTITTATTTTAKPTTSLLPRNMIIGHDEPSIEELFLFDEAKRRRRRRDSNDTVIHQQCAQQLEGPLYGYDQTHCYCNSNLCNSNIQRCIYEVTSKRHFACYHGSNSSQYPLEIRHKCRSCRIHMDYNAIYHYECLTFGEREQNNRTQCTCQRPMCNQDPATCQKFQQIPSQPRTNAVLDLIFNITATESTPHTSTSSTTTTTLTTTTTTATTTTTTTTTTSTTSIITTTTISASSFTTEMISSTEMISTTTSSSLISSSVAILLTHTDSTMIETENHMSTENMTIINESTMTNDNTTTLPELKPLKTVMIVISNHADIRSWKLTFRSTLFQFLFVSIIYSM